MKDTAQNLCSSFETIRHDPANQIDSLVDEAIDICKKVLIAFEGIDAAYHYMENDLAKNGLRSVFLYAASKPHHDYDDFAFKVGTSTTCFDVGNGISSFMGSPGYDDLKIPSLFDVDFKPFCGANYYRRLFPVEFRKQIRSIILSNINNLYPFLEKNTSRGGDTDDGMHLFGELLSSGQTVRSIVADTLFEMRMPNDFYAWTEVLPFVYSDHFYRIIDGVVFKYKDAPHIDMSRQYFNSFINVRPRFSAAYGSAFFNAIYIHIRGESFRQIPNPWPCDEDGFVARKAFVRWAQEHKQDLLETVIAALDLREKMHRGREVSEILKLVKENSPPHTRSNQDLWLEAVLSQLSLDQITTGQKLTDTERDKISAIKQHAN
jgi:hypothetical protein